MGIDYKAIGQRIKARRKALRKTQENLAEALSVSIGYISQVERGVTKISLDTLGKIAAYLNCDVSKFVSGVDPLQNKYLLFEFDKKFMTLPDDQRKIILEIIDILLKHKKN